MNFNFLIQLARRRACRKIRTTMRGYRILKASNQLGWIRRTKRDLEKASVCKISPAASVHFFGAGSQSASLIVQQYLLARIGGVNLNKALLYSIGTTNRPVVFPLPREFLSVLKKNGFAVAARRCSVLWAGYVAVLWCYGVLSIARHLYAALREIARPTYVSMEPFACFVGLTKINLPQPAKDGRSYDIMTWYANWDGSVHPLAALCHDVRETRPAVVNGIPVKYVEHVIPPLNDISGMFRFVRWAIWAVLRSAYDGLRGRWWHALLLSESAKAAVVRFANPNRLAREYLFHCSGSIYRPVWTYEAVRTGSRIATYFYSTFEEFKLPAGYEPNSIYWTLMNWPRYLVWDEYQERLLQRSTGNKANISVVGPIWFDSSAIEPPKTPNNSIAVFDIQPIRSSAHFAFSTMADLGYGDPSVPIKFIQDIESVVSDYDGMVIHKRKRNDGNRFHKGYRSVVAKLSGNSRFIPVEPDISPIRVIESCQAVISMPFTSTAILGRHFGKPSVYYDPIGVLQKDDQGAHGIPILSGADELRSWISELYSKKVAPSTDSESAVLG